VSLPTYGFPVNTCSYENVSSLKIPAVTAIVALFSLCKQLKLFLLVEALNLLPLQLIYPYKNNCMCFQGQRF